MNAKIYIFFVLTLVFFGWKLTQAASAQIEQSHAKREAQIEFHLKGID